MIIEKHCEACGPGTLLVVRVNKKTKREFLGCPNWPECRYTEPMPMSAKMRLAGAPVLPGLE